MAYIFERERLTKLESIIREHYQPAMNLANWSVFVCLDRPEYQDAQLETKVLPCRYVADIFVGSNFENLPLGEKHNAIIHELLHLPQDRLRIHVNTIIKNTHGDLTQAVSDVLTNEVEYNTDWLAGILTKYIPIPDSLKEW
jgi:hypothetical protein